MNRIATFCVIFAALASIAMAESTVSLTAPTPPASPEPPHIPGSNGEHRASGITVHDGGKMNGASVTIGGITSDPAVDGVTIINGDVVIDGEATVLVTQQA